MKKTPFLLLLLLALMVSACNARATVEPDSEETTAPPTAEGESAPTETEEPTEEAASATPRPTRDPEQERVTIRWFVGFGQGTEPAQIEAQEQIVADFNAAQDGIELVLEVYENDVAIETFEEQVALGNAPDIVGPMGIRGHNLFSGNWLDVSGVAETLDLSDFDEDVLDIFREEDEALVGIPLAVFPSFLFVNLDLFEAAGLNPPPQTYGSPYTMPDGTVRDWDMDALRDVAMLLTLDIDGNNATDEDFDPENIAQFGFGIQWTDFRGQMTFFGAGNLIDEEGNAQMPDMWRQGLDWMQAALWDDYFYPNSVYANTDYMGQGNWFASGNIAMAHNHLWYASCCMGGMTDNWDIAAVPASFDGTITAKLHADTFSVMSSTANPDEALEVLSYLVGERAGDLAQVYGGLPARLSVREGYFETLSESLPNVTVNWDVATDSLRFVDNPSHEGELPNLSAAEARYEEFANELISNPDLDLDSAVPAFLADLQAIFDAAQ